MLDGLHYISVVWFHLDHSCSTKRRASLSAPPQTLLQTAWLQVQTPEAVQLRAAAGTRDALLTD